MFLFEHLWVTARVMHNGYISSFFFSQADSAAASGRSTILPRRDSRQGAQDVWAGPGSRKGEGDVSYTSLSKYAHIIFGMKRFRSIVQLWQFSKSDPTPTYW